jgi:hypothetical protein
MVEARLGMVIHSVIPATWEAEVERSPSKASPGKSVRLYLKSKLKEKELGGGSLGGLKNKVLS